MSQLRGVLLRLGSGKVDLVEHRDDLQIVLKREVEVGERLGFDALGGIDQEDRALTCRKAARDLVGEVDVSGSVDEVEDVVAAVLGAIGQAHRLGLDGDAALALDVHAVEVLGTHLAGIDHAGELQHPVGKGRLAVVDMGDDAEIADHRRIGPAGLGSGHPSILSRVPLGGSPPPRRGSQGDLSLGGPPGTLGPRSSRGWQGQRHSRGRGSHVANIKSQIKRNRTNEKARLRNKSVKSSLRTHVRKFRDAADAGDAAKAQELAREACRQLDKAVSKGVIHAKQAANRKSSIAKRAATV